MARKKQGCRLQYKTWYGEGGGYPKPVSAAVARATAGAPLFAKIREKACRTGYGSGGRHGFYTVIAEPVDPAKRARRISGDTGEGLAGRRRR